jgi:phage terminase large subunit-like protein
MEGMKRGGIHGRLAGEGYYRYAEGVMAGEIVAGEFIRLAAARFLKMLDNPAYEFRRGRVAKVVQFIGGMRHLAGTHAGERFRLSDWQGFCVAAIYGFYFAGTKERVVRSAYIEVARKNGKSALGVALALYHLAFDGTDGEGRSGEFGAQVFLAANSKDQVVNSAWPLCIQFVDSLDSKHKLLMPYRDRILFRRKKSFLKVLAADSRRMDGSNPSMYLLDEFHAARNSDVKGVLESGQGMRDNPLGIVITTAGFDRLGPCYEYRGTCIEVLRGFKEQEGLFVAIFSLDDGDDWRDEGVWMKANPNLGVTVKRNFLRGEVLKAMNLSSEETGVKTKNFNIWCSSSVVWIPEDVIAAAVTEVRPGNFEWCMVGIDLSQTLDLTAMAAMFVRDGVVYFRIKYYLPESALREKPRFRDLYGEWRRRGWLTVTGGNVTDYDVLLGDLVGLNGVCRVIKVAYDGWNAKEFILKCQEAGFDCYPFSQSTGNYNGPTKEAERLIRSGKWKMDDNGINRHCFRNVDIVSDIHGNIKPSKRNSEKKIDGVMAALNALGIYLSERYVEPGISYSPY